MRKKKHDFFSGPDGRFREQYYWDSYWHIRGLLVSELYSVVYDILLNFKHLVEQVGHVPNGNRIYYTTRSQPPFFTQMVHDFYIACKNHPEALQGIGKSSCSEILEIFVPVLRKEIEWWDENRSIELKNDVTMYRYASPVTVNRPEAYMADERVLRY